MVTATTIKRARCPVCKEVFDSVDIARTHVREQHNNPIATNPVKNTAPSTNTQQFHFNEYGLSILDDAKRIYPRPLIFTGLTGTGKSSICRAIAADMGLSYAVLNGHQDMEIAQIIGQWIPDNSNGISINWEHGELTKSVISGGIFLFEEINRAPPESHSRLFGLADDGFRYYTLTEAGGLKIPIADNFWLIGTANPTGGGYYTAKIDEAMKRRFAIIEITDIMADERPMLADVFAEPNPMGDKMSPIRAEVLIEQILKFAADLRGGDRVNTFINTGDVRSLAALINNGLHPLKAVKYGVAPKYNKPDGIMEVATGFWG